MKKRLICMLLCIILTGTLLSGCADRSASEKGGEGRWQYSESTDMDGNIQYQFDEVKFTLPALWKDKYDMEIYEDQIIFYHTDSRKMWKENGEEDSGTLLILGYCEDKSYEQLPDYTYLGKDSDGGYYYYSFPTDVQGFVEDERVLSEWQAMESGLMEFLQKN